MLRILWEHPIFPYSASFFNLPFRQMLFLPSVIKSKVTLLTSLLPGFIAEREGERVGLVSGSAVENWKKNPSVSHPGGMISPSSALSSKKQTRVHVLFLTEDFSGCAVRVLLLLLKEQNQGQNGVRRRSSLQGLCRWWRGVLTFGWHQGTRWRAERHQCCPRVCVYVYMCVGVGVHPVRHGQHGGEEGLSRPAGCLGLLGNFAEGKPFSPCASASGCAPTVRSALPGCPGAAAARGYHPRGPLA